MPRIAFIGVLISWLMLARNSLLAVLAASASRRASRSVSLRTRAVMSRAIPTVPATRPSPSCSDVLMVSTRLSLPSAFAWRSSMRLQPSDAITSASSARYLRAISGGWTSRSVLPIIWAGSAKPFAAASARLTAT